MILRHSSKDDHESLCSIQSGDAAGSTVLALIQELFDRIQLQNCAQSPSNILSVRKTVSDARSAARHATSRILSEFHNRKVPVDLGEVARM